MHDMSANQTIHAFVAVAIWLHQIMFRSSPPNFSKPSSFLSTKELYSSVSALASSSQQLSSICKRKSFSDDHIHPQTASVTLETGLIRSFGGSKVSLRKSGDNPRK